jgi:hypothetical protein
MSLEEKLRHVKPKEKQRNLKKERKELHNKREATKDIQEYIDK